MRKNGPTRNRTAGLLDVNEASYHSTMGPEKTSYWERYFAGQGIKTSRGGLNSEAVEVESPVAAAALLLAAKPVFVLECGVSGHAQDQYCRHEFGLGKSAKE